MAQIFVFGHVKADLNQKYSQTGNPYVCFDLAEQIGYGSKRRIQYYQVWAWGNDALRLLRSGVKKYNFIWITGSQELVDCTESEGKSKTMRLKVYLDNWGYLPHDRVKQNGKDISNYHETMNSDSYTPMEGLDGDRESLPE